MRLVIVLLSLVALVSCTMEMQPMEESSLLRRGGRTVAVPVVQDSFLITFREYRMGGRQTSNGQALFGRGWYGRDHIHPYTGQRISVWLYRPDEWYGYEDGDILTCVRESDSYQQVLYDCTR